MIRIEHGLWSKRSEADVHDAVGAACESIGNAEDTLAFFAGAGSAYFNSTATPPGVADWPCDPYQPTPHGYTPCADRSGRATYVPLYRELGTVDDQKRWTVEYGPIVATFQLYSDLGSWKLTNNTSVYRVSNGATTSVNHIALIVGYDDDKAAWIMKNSWGANWGDHGFVYFGYGEANIDGWTKYGITNVNPDPWSRKRHQSGSMMQSGNGETHRNFELLLASNSSSRGGFAHLSRDGTTGKWSVASRFGGGNRSIGQPVIIGTSAHRDFAAAFVDESKTLQQWSYSQANKSWALASSIEDQDIDGFPGMAQDDDSGLVIVVRHADGTLNEVSPDPPAVWVKVCSVLTEPVPPTITLRPLDAHRPHNHQHLSVRPLPRRLQHRPEHLHILLPRHSIRRRRPFRWPVATLLPPRHFYLHLLDRRPRLRLRHRLDTARHDPRLLKHG
jgi:hypothetical protein